jgi:superfamily I DNA/RNA helicase
MIITPKGTQAEVLALEPKGHTVVLGTAGSGKTTMVLLRAELLSNLADKPKVLVVTFNTALVAYMNNIQASNSSKVKVENYHKFARGYLSSVGKMNYNCIADDDVRHNIVKSIINSTHAKYPNESTWARPVQTFIEEIQFIERFGIRTKEEYFTVERVGRADTNIKRENRKWFFAAYEKYKELRADKNYMSGKEYMYDWDDIAISVYDSLLEDNRSRMYKHIIIDEGQDFSPMMLKSLVHAVPADGTFTFFGDVAQQIYGTTLSWKSSGIDVKSKINETKKIWKFENNYRNPREVAVFAQDIANHELWEKKSDEYVTPKFETPAAGVKPTLVKYRDKEAEATALVQLLKNKSGRNVVIVKDRNIVRDMANYLKRNGISAIEIHRETSSGLLDGTYVTTFHSAKGLEFDSVYIPYLNDSEFPDPENLEAAESDNTIYANALKLFYVAVTRAIQSVIMSYSDDLTRLFPKDSKNYVTVDKSKE